MYPVTEGFLEAIERESGQHIRGTLTDITDTTTDITDSLTDRIKVETQCVTDAESFNFGGMYIGTLECVLNLSSRKKDELIDGRITLECGVELSDGSTEWVPLGVWNITDCVLDAGGRLRIKAMDNMKLLRAATEEEKREYIGFFLVEDYLRHISDISGAEFAQTLDELKELTEWNLVSDIYGTVCGKTAWDETRSIAQMLGCFAFANREGKIEFRRLDKLRPVLTVTAEKRHSMRLEEYTYTLRGIDYTRADGGKVSQRFSSYGAIPGFSNNLLMPEGNDNDTFYTAALDKIGENLRRIRYTPGEVTYYGNPALDVGDYILLKGGTLDKEETLFLICCNVWQFRGPQTLTASGFPITGTESSSGGTQSGGTSSFNRNISLTKSISCVELRSYPGALYSSLRTIADCGYSCRAGTLCFLECTVMIRGSSPSEVQLRIYHDMVLQTLQPSFTVSEGASSTVHFSLNLTPSEGVHTLSIAASGDAEIISTAAYIWGQNIAGAQPDATDSKDYIYTISGGKATIDEYIGTGLHPLVPSKLSGADVVAIGRTAFIDSQVVSAVIPDGITEIQ